VSLYFFERNLEEVGFCDSPLEGSQNFLKFSARKRAQIYSAFIYLGFGLTEEIKKDLSKVVKEDGYQNISQAIGVDNQ